MDPIHRIRMKGELSDDPRSIASESTIRIDYNCSNCGHEERGEEEEIENGEDEDDDEES